MCISPSNLPNVGLVGCRNCWQCKKRRVSDLVGRCIAEMMFSKQTLSITLTYSESAGVNSSVLQYDDVQRFLKRIRKDYDVRYIVAGEYGTKKGRAHWHIVLFFKDKVPDVQLDQRQEWKYWANQDKTPIGFVYFQEPDWGGIEYCLKYAIKDQEQRSVHGHLSMSKKPPLGYEYFKWLAEEYVNQGITPTDYYYKFADIKDRKGKTKQFLMQGVTRKNFMEHFETKWREKWNTEPNSEIYEIYQDEQTEIEYTDEEEIKRLHYKPVKYVQSDAIKTNKPSFTDGEIIELEYQGENLLIYQYDDIFEVTQKTTEFFEGTYLEGLKKWRVKDEQQKKQILQQGQIKGRAIYADLLREQLQ